jgi:hypothetical protein
LLGGQASASRWFGDWSGRHDVPLETGLRKADGKPEAQVSTIGYPVNLRKLNSRLNNYINAIFGQDIAEITRKRWSNYESGGQGSISSGTPVRQRLNTKN